MAAVIFFFYPARVPDSVLWNEGLRYSSEKANSKNFRGRGFFTFVSSYFSSWKEAESLLMVCVKNTQI